MQNDIQNLSKELDSVLDEFNPQIELLNSEINVTEKIDPPIVSLRIGEGIISTLGNITTFIGKAKSKKSFLISIAVAVATSKNFVFDLFKCDLPNDKRVILLFDTEQSKYHVQRSLFRICNMIGISEPKNIKVYGLRKYSPEQRMQIVKYAVYNTSNIGIVFIDGIKDLMYDFMDSNESSNTVCDLMKWTEELNISVVTVLHQNKSDNNARGHLGTELMNKSETVISVTKSESDKDISIVEPVACRNMDFEAFGFEIDPNGIPVIAENFELRTSSRQKKSDYIELEEFKKYQLLTQVFSKKSEFSYKDLEQQLQMAYETLFKKTIGVNNVGKIITHSRNTNMILQPGGKGKPYILGNFNSENNI
jgi:hypothetical protein